MADGGGSNKATSASALEKVLQQAWINSQIPKLQRRSVSAPVVDVSRMKRELLYGLMSARAGDVDELAKTYFHKTSSGDFRERLSQPQLESYSDKTEVPQKFSWNFVCRNSSSSSSQEKPSTSQDSRSTTAATTTTDGADSGYGDLAAQTDFFEDFLTEENLEETSAYYGMAKEIAELLESTEGGGPQESSYWREAEYLEVEEDLCEVEKSSAYQAMEKEIADLLSSEDGQDVKFCPTEDQTTLKLMDAYALMLSKHITDVNRVSSAEDVDYRSWITESDEMVMHCDGAWEAYLEGLVAEVSTSRSIVDCSLLACEEGLAVDIPPGTSMTELLYRCALAVSQGDPRTARDYLAELRRRTSPHGDYTERMGHYFLEALVAKLSGTGEELYEERVNNFPRTSTMLKAFRQYVDYCPFIKITHLYTMKSILDAFEGADHVHVIHYGIHFGVEWPSLIQHLSMRPGGPPKFRMTGIDLPCAGDVKFTGRMLVEFAKKWDVPFEYHALCGEWDSFAAKDFNLRDDEALVVTSVKVHLISDESVAGPSPRELFLRRIRSLNPKIFFVFVDNAACNAPLFMTRFRESVKLYSAMFNSFELSMPPDDSHRVVLEREVLGREILNIVACEGRTRVQRQEPYSQWQDRMVRSGFQQLQPKEIIYSKIKAMMSTFHKDYGVGRHEGWIFLGVKNQIVKAMSAWEPKPVLGLIPSSISL